MGDSGAGQTQYNDFSCSIRAGHEPKLKTAAMYNPLKPGVWFPHGGGGHSANEGVM